MLSLWVKSLKRLVIIMKMSQTAHQMYAHIAWTTAARTELIDDRIKTELRSVINEIAEKEGIEIIAFEAVSDHVHLIIRFKPNHQVSNFVKNIKGKSSRVIPYILNKPVNWNKGYSVTTLGPKALNSAIKYVKDQKKHHPERNL